MNKPTHVTDARDRFETGAQRGSDEGKSRPDLIDRDFVEFLNVFVSTIDYEPLYNNIINQFHDTIRRDNAYLYCRLAYAVLGYTKSASTLAAAVLDLGDLLARGAEHYGDNNWRKGIPVWRTKRSLARHFWQWLAGHDDEDHRAAILFNCMVLFNHLNRKDELPASIYAEGPDMVDIRNGYAPEHVETKSEAIERLYTIINKYYGYDAIKKEFVYNDSSQGDLLRSILRYLRELSDERE